MNTDIHCTIKIHEFAALEGWYWEITVPGEIHPKERIKEFTLDDLGLGWLVKLSPLASIHSLSLNQYVYKGSINSLQIVDAINSVFVTNPVSRIVVDTVDNNCQSYKILDSRNI